MNEIKCTLSLLLIILTKSKNKSAESFTIAIL